MPVSAAKNATHNNGFGVSGTPPRPLTNPATPMREAAAARPRAARRHAPRKWLRHCRPRPAPQKGGLHGGWWPCPSEPTGRLHYAHWPSSAPPRQVRGALLPPGPFFLNYRRRARSGSPIPLSLLLLLCCYCSALCLISIVSGPVFPLLSHAPCHGAHRGRKKHRGLLLQIICATSTHCRRSRQNIAPLRFWYTDAAKSNY